MVMKLWSLGVWDLCVCNSFRTCDCCAVRCHGIFRARKKEVNNGVNAWLGGSKVAASLNMCLGKYVCECARDSGERCEESREGIKYKSVKCI